MLTKMLSIFWHKGAERRTDITHPTENYKNRKRRCSKHGIVGTHGPCVPTIRRFTEARELFVTVDYFFFVYHLQTKVARRYHQDSICRTTIYFSSFSGSSGQVRNTIQ